MESQKLEKLIEEQKARLETLKNKDKEKYVRIFSEKEYANIKNTEPELLDRIVEVSKVGDWSEDHVVFTMKHESGEPAKKLLSLTIEESDEEVRERIQSAEKLLKLLEESKENQSL